MTEEDLSNTENSDAMDTLEEAIRVPVISQTRNLPESNDGLTDDTTGKDDVTPPSPERNNESIEEIQMYFCASDEAEAKKLSERNFPRLQYLGLHPRIKFHHLFSIHPVSSDVPLLKKDLNKLNKKVNLISLRVNSERKTYYPDQQNHCQECRSCHLRK